MSTRGSVYFLNEDGDVVFNIYRHCDCYPTGLGADLLEQFRNFDGEDKRKEKNNDVINNLVFHFIRNIIDYKPQNPIEAIFTAKEDVTPDLIADYLCKRTDQEYTYIFQADNKSPMKYRINVYKLTIGRETYNLLFSGDISQFQDFIMQELRKEQDN